LYYEEHHPLSYQRQQVFIQAIKGRKGALHCYAAHANENRNDKLQHTALADDDQNADE